MAMHLLTNSVRWFMAESENLTTEVHVAVKI